MKTIKCAYKYCPNPDIIDKTDAVYVSSMGRYMHADCNAKRVGKQKIFEMFCEYVKNNENGLFIRKKLVDFIDKEGLSIDYALYTMNYIVLNNIPLKSIFGLRKVMEQARVKKAYELMLISQQKSTFKPKEVEITQQSKKTRGWQDLIE